MFEDEDIRANLKDGGVELGDGDYENYITLLLDQGLVGIDDTGYSCNNVQKGQMNTFAAATVKKIQDEMKNDEE